MAPSLRAFEAEVHPNFMDHYIHRSTGAVVEAERCKLRGCDHFDVYLDGVYSPPQALMPCEFEPEYKLIGRG
jgi:hypothetical protein